MATRPTRTYTPRMAGDADKAREVGSANATPADRRPTGILFRSTPESAAQGRITVLACVETVLAMSVTAYIAWRTGSLLYIAVPACVAPLLLLRTPYSTAIGLKLWGRYEAWVDRVSTWDERMLESRRIVFVLSATAVVVLIVSSSLPALACRMAAVGRAMLRHPLATFGAIPGNWRRVALATDLHHPPEIVPGIEKADVDSSYRFAMVLYLLLVSAKVPHIAFPRIPGVVIAPIAWIGSGIFFVIWFVPALIYRWSLKSTSFVYFPLLWAAFTSRRGQDTVAQRLETIATDQTERLVRWYAGFVLIFLTILPVVLAAPLQPTIARVQSALSVELFDFWLFTGRIKLWHLVRVINAVITMGLFVFADKALRRIKYGRPHSDQVVHRVIGTCLYVRGFLGVYLWAKLLHIVVTAVDWSAVDWRIVPW